MLYRRNRKGTFPSSGCLSAIYFCTMLNCVVSEEHKLYTSTAEAALTTLSYIWLLTKILLKSESSPSTGSIMQLEPFPCIWKRTHSRNIKHQNQALYLLIMIDSLLTYFPKLDLNLSGKYPRDTISSHIQDPNQPRLVTSYCTEVSAPVNSRVSKV